MYRDGNIIMVDDDRLKLKPGEEIQYKKVRFRTLGCYPLTGGCESEATTLDEIIEETLSAVHQKEQQELLIMKQQEVWKEEKGRDISKMKGLLKFITCGSVDDGKSTLIGHILYDAKLLYADQKRALELEVRLEAEKEK